MFENKNVLVSLFVSAATEEKTGTRSIYITFLHGINL